jgi:hypothetical protein
MSARAAKALLNRDLIAQIGTDSGALTMLGVVIHRFREPGEYLGVADRGGRTGSFRLTVDPASPAMQANVDLAALDSARARNDDCGCHADEPPHRHFVVNPEGWVVFHVSRGRVGYAVRVGLTHGDEPAFNSESLDGEDMFAVTLLRPGTYSVRNTTTGAVGEIVVEYPREPGKEPRPPGPPVEVTATEKILRPAKIAIRPGQGQLYRFRTPSRIAIELVTPDDGPKARTTPAPKRGARRAPPRRRS